MNKLRVGFIGAGRISDLHAIEYLNNPQAELLAVCDISQQIASMRAAAWGIPQNRVFTDYHDLLAIKEIDLVEILLPHHLHHQATLDAAMAGKHISLQKPMAMSVAEADAMIAATREAGVIFKVFENFRHYGPKISRLPRPLRVIQTWCGSGTIGGAG